jgi:uncharacterized protein
MSICSTSSLTPPPSLFDRAVALAALAALAAQAMVGTWPVSIAAVGVALVGWRFAAPAARSLATLAACLVLAMRLGIPWQLAMAAALVGFAMVVRALPAIAPSPTWRAGGRIPVLPTALVAGVTPFALTAWLLLARPDLRDVLRAYVPDLPLPLLIGGAVVFACANATLEELVWRGLVQDRLEPLFGVRAAILLQAASFGLQHANGVPRGAVGMLLAGSWAVLLGILRRRAGGLRAPIVAHVVADATIAVLILGVVR